MKLLLKIAALSILILFNMSCQTTSIIGENYKGVKWNKISNKNNVSILDLKTKEDYNLVSDQSKLADNGYKIFGISTFYGDLENDDSIKSYASSIGADCVVRGIDKVATDNRSRMVLTSYTPGSVIYGNSNSYSNTNVDLTSSNPYNYNNSINTYGNINTNTNTETSVYVPGTSTYSKEEYQVLVGRQLYVFLVSPQQVLNNIETYFKIIDINQKFSKSDIERFAIIYSKVYTLRIPDRFKGEQYNSMKNITLDNKQLKDLIASEKKNFRAMYVLNGPS